MKAPGGQVTTGIGAATLLGSLAQIVAPFLAHSRHAWMAYAGLAVFGLVLIVWRDRTGHGSTLNLTDHGNKLMSETTTTDTAVAVTVTPAVAAPASALTVAETVTKYATAAFQEVTKLAHTANEDYAAVKASPVFGPLMGVLANLASSEMAKAGLPPQGQTDIVGAVGSMVDVLAALDPTIKTA